MTLEEQIKAIDFTPIIDVIQWGKVELQIREGKVRLVRIEKTIVLD